MHVLLFADKVQEQDENVQLLHCENIILLFRAFWGVFNCIKLHMVMYIILYYEVYLKIKKNNYLTK